MLAENTAVRRAILRDAPIMQRHAQGRAHPIGHVRRVAGFEVGLKCAARASSFGFLRGPIGLRVVRGGGKAL